MITTVKNKSLWAMSVVSGMCLGAGAMVWSEPHVADKVIVNPGELSKSFRDAAKEVLPSVVSIKAVTKGGVQVQGVDEEDILRGLPNDEIFRQFFGDRMPRGGRRMMPRQVGTGSGVIVDDTGVVLTNAHVVASADEVEIELHNGHRVKAKSWVTDPRRDVAIVKFETSEKLHAAKLGDSDKMQIGDWVLALGNPFNVGTSVTQGIISATGRTTNINELENYIQTDAAVNPGNSGGPLINLNGEVIGINTAISTNSGGYDGVSFAIPVNMIRPIAEQLIKNGTVQRSYLGIGLQALDQDLREYYGIQDGGVLVTMVSKDTPAAKAGVEPRDIIVELAGRKITGRSALTNLVDGLPSGQPQKLVVIRKGKQVELTVVPEQMPDGYTDALKSTMKTAPQAAQTEDRQLSRYGLGIVAISPEVRQGLSLPDDLKGVVVEKVNPGGAAQEAGLSRGDVITSVNETPVNSIDEFGEALKQADPKKGSLFEVYKNGANLQVVVRPTEGS